MPENHDGTLNIKTRKTDGPLECANQRLKMLDIQLRQLIGGIQFRVSLRSRVGRLLPKDQFVGTEQTQNVGLVAKAESAVVVAVDVRTKMILHWSNTLELVTTIIEQNINKFLRVSHGNCKIVNINANVLVVCSTILHPNIRISFARCESKITKCIGKTFMPPGPRSTKTMQSNVDQEDMTFQIPKLRTSNKIDLSFVKASR